jgi:hypothetical protein
MGHPHLPSINTKTANETSIQKKVPMPGLIKGLFIDASYYKTFFSQSVKMDADANRANIHSFFSELLKDNHQKAGNHGEEGNAFHQCGSDNHSGTDVATSLRLASHTLHCTLTNLTNT